MHTITEVDSSDEEGESREIYAIGGNSNLDSSSFSSSEEEYRGPVDLDDLDDERSREEQGSDKAKSVSFALVSAKQVGEGLDELPESKIYKEDRMKSAGEVSDGNQEFYESLNRSLDDEWGNSESYVPVSVEDETASENFSSDTQEQDEHKEEQVDSSIRQGERGNFGSEQKGDTSIYAGDDTGNESSVESVYRLPSFLEEMDDDNSINGLNYLSDDKKSTSSSKTDNLQASNNDISKSVEGVESETKGKSEKIEESKNDNNTRNGDLHKIEQKGSLDYSSDESEITSSPNSNLFPDDLIFKSASSNSQSEPTETLTIGNLSAIAEAVCTRKMVFNTTPIVGLGNDNNTPNVVFPEIMKIDSLDYSADEDEVIRFSPHSNLFLLYDDDKQSDDLIFKLPGSNSQSEPEEKLIMESLPEDDNSITSSPDNSNNSSEEVSLYESNRVEETNVTTAPVGVDDSVEPTQGRKNSKPLYLLGRVEELSVRPQKRIYNHDIREMRIKRLRSQHQEKMAKLRA